MNFSTLFRPIQKPKPILTSRPIFQHSSSFIGDGENDYDLEKSAVPPSRIQDSTTTSRGGSNRDVQRALRRKTQLRLHFVLHALNIIFTLISSSLFITAIPIWNANFHHTSSLISTDYTDGLVLAPLITSLVISIYSMITVHTTFLSNLPVEFVRIGPKSFILISLTIVLTLAPLLASAATNCLALAWQAPVRNTSGVVVCNLGNLLSRPCQPILYQIGELQVAAMVAGGLAWCIWIVIFLVSARDVVHEKRARARARAREARKMRRNERRENREQQRKEDAKSEKRPQYLGEYQFPNYKGVVPRVERDESSAPRDKSPKPLSQGPSTLRNDITTQSWGPSSEHNRHLGKTRTLERPPAVRHAAHKIQAKETIQEWLSHRYV